MVIIDLVAEAEEETLTIAEALAAEEILTDGIRLTDSPCTRQLAATVELNVKSPLDQPVQNLFSVINVLTVLAMLAL